MPAEVSREMNPSREDFASLLAESLAKRVGDRAVLLHDCKVPKTRGNIDHIAVGPNGIWVIDAKHYKGAVARRDVGGFFREDLRLYVGGRDQTKLVTGVLGQATGPAPERGRLRRKADAFPSRQLRARALQAAAIPEAASTRSDPSHRRPH